MLAALGSQVRRNTFAYPSEFASAAHIRFAEVEQLLRGPAWTGCLAVSGGSEAIEIALKFARHYVVAIGQALLIRLISRMPSHHGRSPLALRA
jgi:adenosylmethionine-8-amino-7-oxononanoate aminotransferase